MKAVTVKEQCQEQPSDQSLALRTITQGISHLETVKQNSHKVTYSRWLSRQAGLHLRMRCNKGGGLHHQSMSRVWEYQSNVCLLWDSSELTAWCDAGKISKGHDSFMWTLTSLRSWIQVFQVQLRILKKKKLFGGQSFVVTLWQEVLKKRGGG